MKKPITCLKLALIALSLYFSALAPLNAGAPLKINFQGRLEESGQPAEGTKTFIFKIYTAMSGGSLVWTSQAQNVALTNGVFSVVLATGSPVNLSTATFSGARYVEIIVNGYPLSPRQEMVSAPYALVAQALSSDARISLANLEKDPSSASTINTATNAVDWTQLKNVPAAFADGTDDVVAAVLSTAAITSGKFGDERVAISTGAFYGGFNAPDQLVQLDGAGKLPASLLSGPLPALDGAALTGVTASSIAAVNVSSGALGNSVIASSIAVGGVYSASLQAGSVTDLKVLLTTAAISSGKFGDERVSISTGAFYGGFNAAGQLVRLDASGRLPAGTSIAGAIALPVKRITAADFPYTVTENDSTVLIDASAAGAGANVVIELPDAAGIAGRIYTFKRLDNLAGLQVVNLIPALGGNSIDGSFLFDLYLNGLQGEAITLQSDGSNWMILSWYK
ncbi:MAG: hypothetical protein PHV36_05305 [Elusimicrobiales bacterium]|nr:hypothetical protein [Elusimicrobiales bacterium]